MALRLMVFDVAGTTVWDGDNAVARCVCEALEADGYPTALERVNPVMGMPKPLAIGQLLTEALGKPVPQERVTRVHADFQRRMIEYYQSSPSVRPLDGAIEVFSALRERGVAVGLDTGFDRPIMNAILDRLGWSEGVVDDTVTSDEVEHGRPAPDMIEALMAAAGVSSASEVGKIGDSVSDVEQGVNAGCGLVVAVRGQRLTSEVVASYPGVQSLSSLMELLPLVDAVAEGATP